MHCTPCSKSSFWVGCTKAYMRKMKDYFSQQGFLQRLYKLFQVHEMCLDQGDPERNTFARALATRHLPGPGETRQHRKPWRGRISYGRCSSRRSPHCAWLRVVAEYYEAERQPKITFDGEKLCCARHVRTRTPVSSFSAPGSAAVSCLKVRSWRAGRDFHNQNHFNSNNFTVVYIVFLVDFCAFSERLGIPIYSISVESTCVWFTCAELLCHHSCTDRVISLSWKCLKLKLLFPNLKKLIKLLNVGELLQISLFAGILL